MKVGRKAGEDLLYARELGISKRSVMLFGGAKRLRAMAPETLAVILAAQTPPKKPSVSMRALGMSSRVPGKLRSDAAA